MRAEPSVPRNTPCASCPYRQGVPSGIWGEEEYSKLPRYDGDMSGQPAQAFACHHSDGKICAGWLGHRDPSDLLAVRFGIIRGDLAPECAEYSTDVPLFPTGQAAADHGMQEIRNPSEDAQDAIVKIVRIRAGSGRPVTL
jgi:hypothetical protein